MTYHVTYRWIRRRRPLAVRMAAVTAMALTIMTMMIVVMTMVSGDNKAQKRL